MTSTVKVTAHCSPTKEVLVEIVDVQSGKVLEHANLQDGQSKDFYIYDNRSLTTSERIKE